MGCENDIDDGWVRENSASLWLIIAAQRYAEGVSLRSPGSRSAPWVHDKKSFRTLKG